MNDGRPAPESAMSHRPHSWQSSAWQALLGGRARLAHAWLLHGPPGVGKVDFALAAAQAFLCESPNPDHAACGRCNACLWFAAGNHPDFRLLRPEALEDDEEGAEEGAAGRAKGKAPSKDIRIEQIRRAQEWAAIATHRGGLRVIVVYPAEAMNGPAANALLKTLEEPPADTVFLLVADRPDRLLPTVRSRCRALPLPCPPEETAAAWLEAQGVSGAREKLAAVGGAPLAVWRAEQAGEAVQPAWLGSLLKPDALDPLAFADGAAEAGLPAVVDGFQKLVFDLWLQGSTGQVRYFPRSASVLAKLAQLADGPLLQGFAAYLTDQKKVANHPLNGRLFVTDLALRYRALFECSEPRGMRAAEQVAQSTA